MASKEEVKHELEEGAVILAALVIVVAIGYSAYSYVASNYGDQAASIYKVAEKVAQDSFAAIVTISIPVSLLLIIGIVAAVTGMRHVRKKEEELYDLKVEQAYDETVKGDPELGKKWQTVMTLVDSPSQGDWRQAIIEADIILGDILTRMQYHGDSIGEQLKGANKADFNTLDQAWEAHKVRNQIAHEGSDFQMSQHEAKRVVGLYRQVFEEFFYI